jgi:hypothetical protein
MSDTPKSEMQFCKPTRYQCKVHGEQIGTYIFHFGTHVRHYCPECMMALWDKHCEQLEEQTTDKEPST